MPYGDWMGKGAPMNSTAKSNATSPDDVLVARADERLAHAYEQLARADDQLARVTEHLSKLEHDAAHDPGRARRGRPALRGFIGVLLAACILGAAFVSQSSYGDAAKPIIARWAPQLVMASSLPMEKLALTPEHGPPVVQAAAAEPASAQATPLAQDATPAAAPASPELTELLQAMARDVANVEQGIEQLKASQAQMASDNAKAVEELKASQDEMTRLIAKTSEQKAAEQKASEQSLRSNASVLPPQSAATPAHKPAPVPRPQEARARSQTPNQLQPRGP